MSFMDKIEDASTKDKLFVTGIIVFTFACVLGLYAIASHQESEWHRFVEKHNCKKVTDIESIVTYKQGLTVGPDGAMHPSLHTITIPSADAYVCDGDDGVTYWR